MSDNRFPIILGSVTAVVAGGLIYWGFTQGKRYDEAEKDYKDAVGEIQRLTRGPIHPSTENLQAKKTAVEEYAVSAADLQTDFDPYRKPELPAIEVADFTEKLKTTRREVVGRFEEAGATVPEEFYMGLRRYTEIPVTRSFAPLVSYQLEAFTELFEKLADAKPAAVLNVHRPTLPEEEGKDAGLEGATYREHPIEVSFSGSEASLRQFLGSLDDSEQYYYVVRTLRVRNERDTAPNAGDAKFEQPQPAVTPGGADPSNPFGAFFGAEGGDTLETPAPEGEAGAETGEGTEEVPEEAVAEAPPAPAPSIAADPGDTGEILKQVLGAENLEVFLRIDVLQFLNPQELPQR